MHVSVASSIYVTTLLLIRTVQAKAVFAHYMVAATAFMVLGQTLKKYYRSVL
jgi:hypothetical protein